MNKRSLIVHATTTIIGLCIGTGLGIYVATRALLTSEIAKQTTVLVCLHMVREDKNLLREDEITDNQINNNIQELKRLSSGGISVFQYWTPKNIELMRGQERLALNYAEDFFNEKQSFLSEETKKYLQQEATK